MANYSLDPLWHTAMPVYQNAVGLGTTALSAIAIYLMLTKTPPSGKAFVNYLIALQLAITLVDLNFGFLTSPILLYPMSGYLCNGILCTWFGLSGHPGISIMFFSILLVCISIFYCFHYKYVMISSMVDSEPIKGYRHIIFRIVTFVAYMIPGVLQMGLHRNMAGGPVYAQTNFPSLYYLIEDPKYRGIAYDTNMYPEYFTLFAGYTFIIMLSFAIIVMFFVISCFSKLAKQKSLSAKTTQLQNQTMKQLLIQTMVPLTIQLTPELLHTFSLLTLSLDPNINNAVFCFQLMHAFVHTIILIGMTPSYRGFFKLAPMTDGTTKSN